MIVTERAQHVAEGEEKLQGASSPEFTACCLQGVELVIPECEGFLYSSCSRSFSSLLSEISIIQTNYL